LVSVNHFRGSFVDQLIILGGVLLISVNHFRRNCAYKMSNKPPC